MIRGTRLEHLVEMPNQGGLDELIPFLNLQEQQAVKVMMNLASFVSYKVHALFTGCFADRWQAYLRLTWPGLGLGEGQGCRGEGVGQGAGAGSIDSMDHQKPGESC